ncbi:Peptidase M16 C-terminal [Arabidopsis suecica]|uniref:Peptidase M16 C-terminal n=1 Tax=Arabidopsis suecica TaxID=45249 RepID=A0A8T2FTY9_ARASU|nr:Peptidase M16 C-terminal [Arabidopsis suecica]
MAIENAAAASGECGVILKARTDKREYRRIVLKNSLEVLVKAVPIKQGHNLTVSWPVTPSIHHYEEAPCTYVGHLIGHEGKGSLFHALKILGWATGLYAGEPDWTIEYSFFNVSINLTDACHEHMKDILGLLFRQIKLLQQSGVSQWIFDELSAIFEAEFHYQAKIDPISYAVNISSNMTVEPWYNTAEKIIKFTIQMDFNCPLAVSSPATVVLSNSSVWLLVDYLNEYAYYAQAARLHYGLSLSDNGFELSLTGFNHKLRILLEAHDPSFYGNGYKGIPKLQIPDGTLKFNRIDAEVTVLRELKKEELINFFDEYTKVGAPKRKSLSVCVYGNQHLKEMSSDKDKVVSTSIEIEDIVGFRNSQPLYASLKGCSQLTL